jgi:hypothetical protein
MMIITLFRVVSCNGDIVLGLGNSEGYKGRL